MPSMNGPVPRRQITKASVTTASASLAHAQVVRLILIPEVLEAGPSDALLRPACAQRFPFWDTRERAGEFIGLRPGNAGGRARRRGRRSPRAAPLAPRPA